MTPSMLPLAPVEDDDDDHLDLPSPPDLEPLLPRLPILDLPAFTEVKRGPYVHTISATRWRDGRPEVCLKFGSTLRGAIWAPLSEVRQLDGSPINLITPDPVEQADRERVAAEERYWADQRLTRLVDALAPNPRR